MDTFAKNIQNVICRFIEAVWIFESDVLSETKNFSRTRRRKSADSSQAPALSTAQVERSRNGASAENSKRKSNLWKVQNLSYFEERLCPRSARIETNETS